MLLGRAHVRLLVYSGQLTAYPEEKRGFCLENCHASWVDRLVSLASLEDVLGHELADDSLWVVVLVAHQGEDSRGHCQTHEVRVQHALFKPHQLLDEF